MSMRVALVGVGGIAQKGYLPVLATWEGVELMLCRRNATELERLQSQYHVERATTNLEQLIDWKPDAAFVLTPTPTHAEITRQLLHAGIDVLLEKPATPTAAEAQELAELADARQRILMIAFNRRYAPLSILARRMWGEQSIGFATFEKHRTKPFFRGFDEQVNEEDIHIIDMLRFLCGEAQAVKTVYTMDEKEGYFLQLSSLLKLENGGIATISATMRAGQWYEHYALNGGGSSLYLDAFSELRFVTPDREQKWSEPYPSAWQSSLVGRGFVGQMEHFFECVRTRQQPLTNAWDSVNTQRLVEDIVAKSRVES